ncbi:hypothetical protein OFP19_20150, partial [Escherichia coli]|nr:hypothetical protein [Escherichia coli]
VSPGRTFAPSRGLTGWPDVTPPGHTEQATPVGAPMRTNATAILRHVALTRCRFSAHFSSLFYRVICLLTGETLQIYKKA